MATHINDSSRPPQPSNLKRAGTTFFRHIRRTGVGIVCSVAYFDPGNWGVDLQAGSSYGYRLLFVVLLAGIFAVFLQVLASRLGCVTGLDLASHTRLLLYNRTKRPRLVRWLVLYPIYAAAEIAIIATDLAELLGSAIALCLLFPKLKLWQGVLLTASDVILVLAMGDPLRGHPARMFEFLIAALVMAVLLCMAIVISQIQINWGLAFDGFLPSKYVFGSGALYSSIGIIGATIMPHSLFLGSALATQDRIGCRPEEDDKLLGPTSAMIPGSPLKSMLLTTKDIIVRAFRIPPASLHATDATRHSEHENNPLPFVRAHIYHGIVDVVVCLLGFAVLINSLILILSGAVFYFQNPDEAGAASASLFDAYDLIRSTVGKPPAILFAIALLASGQSASFVATVAGQAVSEGFLRWRISPVIRRLLTRLIAIIPSMIVAIVVGRNGINALLVLSQVILSIALPFVTFPLIYCTSSKTIMRVRKPSSPNYVVDDDKDELSPIGGSEEGGLGSLENGEEWVDFSNGKVMIAICIVIWSIIVIANVYVLVSLAMGSG
ncbi:Manganese transporter pdt1 [Leucoagaricus sp. SymC.cos]|nr:Manganese transporter pdt1 [Leucoagaricus sp. SymC.cos]